MGRDGFVPIDVDPAEAIGGQQQAVLTEFPSATCLLPRQTRNPDGHFGFSPSTFCGELAESSTAHELITNGTQIVCA